MPSFAIRVFHDRQYKFFSWHEAGTCAVNPCTEAAARFGSVKGALARIAEIAALRDACAEVIALSKPYRGIRLFDREETRLAVAGEAYR